MSLTTVIVVNAVLDVLVIVGLFRVMWFGISKPFEQPGAPRLRQTRRETTTQRRAEQSRAHAGHAA